MNPPFDTGQRQNFERFASDKMALQDFEQNEFGDYRNSYTNEAWAFWQAAQAALRPSTALKGDALYESHGYALATRVLQSDLYHQLDERERSECDALVRGQAAPSHVAASSDEVDAVIKELREQHFAGPLALRAEALIRTLWVNTAPSAIAEPFGPAVARSLLKRGIGMPPGILSRIYDGKLAFMDLAFLAHLFGELWPPVSGVVGTIQAPDGGKAK